MRSLAAGHSLIVVEHNLHVMAAADFIIDMGPGPAAAGGGGIVVRNARTGGCLPAVDSWQIFSDGRQRYDSHGVSRRAAAVYRATRCPWPYWPSARVFQA